MDDPLVVSRSHKSHEWGLHNQSQQQQSRCKRSAYSIELAKGRRLADSDTETDRSSVLTQSISVTYSDTFIGYKCIHNIFMLKWI